MVTHKILTIFILYFVAQLIEVTTTTSNPPRREVRTWPNATVLYTIDDQFTSSQRAVIQGAMEEIEEKSCIKFRQRSSSRDRDYIALIGYKGGCSSPIGRVGGRQELHLNPHHDCVQHGIVIHKLLHGLGLHHEHTRPDRDLYIKVNLLDNLRGKKGIKNFKIRPQPSTLRDLAYDYGTIMHYSNYAGSKAPTHNGKQTLISKRGNHLIGQRNGLSRADVTKLHRLYQIQDDQQCPCQGFQCQVAVDQCIWSKLWCDGHVDCPDGSDEAFCTDCSPLAFSCGNDPGQLKCLPLNRHCDGERDCRDNWDELNCPPKCPADTFTCASGQCIHLSYRCDNRRHCHDGSDEVNCNYGKLKKGQRRQKRSGAPFKFSGAINGTEKCAISRHFLPQLLTVINGLVQEYLGDEVNEINNSTFTPQEIRSAADAWSSCQNEVITQQILKAIRLLATNFNSTVQKNGRLSNFTMPADVERLEIETELDRLGKEYAQVEKSVADQYESIRSQLRRKEVRLKNYLDNLETVLAIMYKERKDHPCAIESDDSGDHVHTSRLMKRPIPCPLTISALTQIKRELAALVGSVNSSMENSCAQLKNGILHTLSDLQSLVKVRVDEKKLGQKSEERLAQIGNLKLQLQRMRMEVDNLRRQSVQQYEVNISGIQVTVTELEEKLNMTLDDIIEVEERGQKDWTKFIISLVSCGDPKMAKLQFIQMTAPASVAKDDNGTILSHIVSQSYDKKIENFDLILNFLLALPLTSQRVVGLTQLVHEINLNGSSIHRPQILKLMAHIDTNMTTTRRIEGLENLKRLLLPARTQILREWAETILNGDLKGGGNLLHFMNDESDQVTQNLVNDLFDQIYQLENHDGKGKVVELVLKFVDELNPPALNYTFEALLHLFSTMLMRGEVVGSSELMILGHWLKKMEGSNLINQTQLKMMQKALPPGVQSLVEAEIVVMKSRRYGGGINTRDGRTGGNVQSGWFKLMDKMVKMDKILSIILNKLDVTD